MAAQEVRLVTVSREFGAGGSEFAAALGDRLGWRVLDHDIVEKVADRMRLDSRTVEHFDEHAPTFLARIASVLIVPQSDFHSFPASDDVPGHDLIAETTRAVIEQEARELPLIVVGHGAQCIFSGRPDALHIRVIAPVGQRVARVVHRLGIGDGAASSLLRGADADRQAYVQRYFHRDWRDNLLYDLQLNTSTISIEEGAQLAAVLVRARSPAATARP